MSLYENTSKSQSLAIGNSVSTSGLPTWLLILAGYFVVNTLTNRIPTLIYFFTNGLEPELIEFFLGAITGIISVAALGLFLFRRNLYGLYYLTFVALLVLTLGIAISSGVVKGLSPFFNSLQGLDSIPSSIIKWLIGWENVSEFNIRLLRLVGSVISVAFCALMLYFHNRRQPVTQVN